MLRRSVRIPYVTFTSRIGGGVPSLSRSTMCPLPVAATHSILSPARGCSSQGKSSAGKTSVSAAATAVPATGAAAAASAAAAVSETQGSQSGKAAGSASGFRTVGVKLSEEDELARAFNSFSKSVGGCTQEEFLLGVKQAYYSLGVMVGALEEPNPPAASPSTPARVISGAETVTKLLDKAFKPEVPLDLSKKSSTIVDPSSSSSSFLGSVLSQAKARNSAPKAGEGAPHAVTVTGKEPAALLTEVAMLETQRIKEAIMSIVPVSAHLAETIFSVWLLQRDKKANLQSIAAPSDYVLQSKLAVFARLDKARMYFLTDGIGADVDVSWNNDFLEQAKEATPLTERVAEAKDGASVASTTKAKAAEEEDEDEGMVEVTTNTMATANISRHTPSQTFIVNKRAKTTAEKQGEQKEEVEKAAQKKSVEASVEEGEEKAASRLRITNTAPVPSVAPTAAAAPSEDTKKEPVSEESSSPQEDGGIALYIKLNGTSLPPIPSSARACALLMVDVVVPPERYAYNFKWFYKRIVGYENEYERIAAARVFATNSPKGLANCLDFVVRMFSGKPVEFMFTKSIGKMIGIPEDVSETPPATRKLVCMYMDASQKWILSDVIPLAPVLDTKIPKV